MLNLISAILFSFSANLDNIVIGISYGIKKIHITNITIFFITLFTSIFTLLSMLFGKYITLFISEKTSNLIGSYILIIFGLYYIIKEIILSFKKKEYYDSGNTMNNISKISIIEILTMIFILSLNNIGIGIAASATGINIIYSFIFSFLFGITFLIIGNNIGKLFTSKYIEKYCNIISALILILIGIIQIC